MKWLDRIGWDGLRPILKGDLARLLVVIPIVGYLIIFNDSIVNSFEFTTITQGYGTIIFSTIHRLQLLYFGMITLGVCTLWFNVRCPISVKQAADAVSFKSFAREHYSIRDFVRAYMVEEERSGFGMGDNDPYDRDDLRSFLQAAVRNSIAIPDADSEIFLEEAWFLSASIQDREAAIQSHSELISDLLYLKYENDRRSQRKELKSIWLITAFALILIALPSIDTFISVLYFTFGGATIQ